MNRSFVVKLALGIFAGMAMVLLAGCGGGGGKTGLRGEVSGVIFDVDGYVVRDALVKTNGQETYSNSAGVFALTKVPARDVVITAEVTQNGVRYYGQNIATVSYGERTKSVNIAVFRADQLAAIHGTVRNRSGSKVQGLRVFLRPDDDPTTEADDTLLTSAVGVTNSSGNFEIGGLRAGLTYRLQVNGRTFNSAFGTFTLAAGEDRRLDFQAPNAEEVSLPTPSNLRVVAYTSPAVVRSDSRLSNAIESVRQRIRPQATHTITRTTVRGNPIEVDLFWNPIQSTGLLGFGVYRGANSAPLRNVGFLRDPQATFYADYDENIVENTPYTYAITALDTLYDGEFGETDASDTDTATPLGDLIVTDVSSSATPTFRWQALTGATRFSVFLYTQYPAIGVDPIFSNYDTPASGTSYTYNGPALTRGRTYYFIATAERTDLKAVSLSRVGTFTVP